MKTDEKILARNRKWRRDNKHRLVKSHKEWLKRHPWYYHYAGARARCKPQNKYGKRGLKFEMTIEDFEYLWYRDAAHLLEKPSIDRIDNDKGYVLENCRFIEFTHNCKKNKFKESLK